MKKATLQQGFSLVETLVAITILLLVIVGPLTISSSSVRSTAFASEQVVAFFLAQEGSELAQKARDDLLLEYFTDTNSDPAIFTPQNPDPWADFTTSATYATCYTQTNAGCGLMVNSNGSLAAPRTCSTAADCLLYLDTGSGVTRSRYTYTSTANPTIFNRTIKLARVGANEVSVISTVTWQSGFSRDEQKVTVQTSLFNVYGTN
jgi:prepilin-type N-terminal cleavage/methylation domain-containing protein